MSDWSRRAWIAAAIIGVFVMLTADYPADPFAASGKLSGIVALIFAMAWGFDALGRKWSSWRA